MNVRLGLSDYENVKKLSPRIQEDTQRNSRHCSSREQ